MQAIEKHDDRTRVTAFHYKISTQIDIDAPASEVWSILMDSNELRKWSTSFQGMSGELSKGGNIVAIFKLNGITIKAKHKLTQFEEGKRFAWSDPIIPGLRDNHHYIVTAIDENKTRFTQTDELKGFMALFLGFFTSKWLYSLYLDFNKKLKAAAEHKTNKR